MKLRVPKVCGRRPGKPSCEIGRRLELLRLKAGIFSVADWARLLGLSESSYRHCRAGRPLIRADLVLAEAERLAKERG